MTDNAIRSGWGMTEDEVLEHALARSRAAPDYTMGALAQQTGVPPDTLRSWERRYGFPEPARTETNRRIYSERDVVAVNWLRDQTERGQGISEAINMLRSRMPGAESPITANELVRAAPTPAFPLERLVDKLRSGDIAGAQSAWDDLVIGLSSEAIGNALLALNQRLHDQPAANTSLAADNAHAFLVRKATVLLDHADPDRGRNTLGILTSGAQDDALPATVLAAALARAGFRIITPFLAITSLKAVDMVHHNHPEAIIVIGTSDDHAASFSRLVPGVDIHRWNPDHGDNATSTLQDVVEQVQHSHESRLHPPDRRGTLI